MTLQSKMFDLLRLHTKASLFTLKTSLSNSLEQEDLEVVCRVYFGSVLKYIPF